MKIVEGDKEIEVDKDTVRRILNCARINLEMMKKAEGRSFPKVDQSALTTILHLQYTFRMY